ncbi:MAG: response regulator [bacterium]
MKKIKILVLSDDAAVVSPLKGAYDVEAASSRSDIIKRAGGNPGALAVIDCDMKDAANGIALYKEMKKLSPDTPVIMLSSAVAIPEAVEAAKLGVSDFIRKPATADALLASVKRNLSSGWSVEIKPRTQPGREWLLGRGNKVKTLFKDLEAAINGKKNILFISEPGADIMGLAKLVRDHSKGVQKLTTIDMLPYQRENLESIFWTVLQEALVDSDMIYLERFSAANEKLQASVIDYVKNRVLRVQVKLIASARIKEVSEIFNDWEKISVPGLKDRKEDLPDILGAYVDKYSIKFGKKISGIDLDVLKMINDYSWPGNYRELECVVENSALSCEGSVLTLKDVQLMSKMVFEGLQSSQTENLLDFRNNIEKKLVNIFHKKTGSDDVTANLLDIPRSRISEGLTK